MPHFTCGGARPQFWKIGYALPPGTTYGGKLVVPDVAELVVLEPAKPCPPTPMPP